MIIENMISVYKPKNGTNLELKSCPFCGSNETVYVAQNHDAGIRWAVVCMGCMAGVDVGYAQTKHQIQPFWNNRI